MGDCNLKIGCFGCQTPLPIPPITKAYFEIEDFRPDTSTASAAPTDEVCACLHLENKSP